MTAPADSSPPHLLPAALAYVNRFQWPVFPVHGIQEGRCTCGNPDCKRPGKHPIGKLAPQGLNNASRDPEIVTTWWRIAPYANIGVPTGAISGLVVLDIDTAKYGEDSKFELEQRFGPLPFTVLALTGGGGYHYLFAHPGPHLKIRNSVENLGPGLDVRGDGGYIVVAPSSHISGHRYEWELSCHPKDVALAPLPDWLLERIVEAPRPLPDPFPAPSSARLYPSEIARIRAALAYLDPEPYDDWLRVGMALHASGDDERGFALWTEWAARSAKFDLADHQRRWASFHRGGPNAVTLGSLFAAAKAAGYVPPGPPPEEPPPPPSDPPPGAATEGLPGWEELLYRNGRNDVITSAANIETILSNHDAWSGLLGYDEMSYRTIKRRPPPYPGGEAGEWSDADDTRTAIWLERGWRIRPRNTAVAQVATAVAQQSRFHQVREWLEGLVWDGIPRLPTFFSDFCGAAQTPYTEAVGRAFFVSAVARALRPGSKVDTMLVLEGAQGIGKSRLILTLFSAAWHIEISYAPGSLDFFQALRGTWCAEFGEMASFDRSEVARIKQVLTQTQDTYRASYGHHSGTYPRQTVFVGSTNRREWGEDETGMRRFWPVECHQINVEAVAELRPHLWAEAVHRFQAGETWWEIPDAPAEQEARFNYDAWEELVARWIEKRANGHHPEFSANDVYQEAIYGFDARNVPPISRADQTRIGKILTRLGWQKKRGRVNGQRAYTYERAPS